jgi:hypothetical protein
MLPLVASSITSKELKMFSDKNAKSDELLSTVYIAIARSARDTIRLYHDLSQQAAKLRAFAPKLRAKGLMQPMRCSYKKMQSLHHH